MPQKKARGGAVGRAARACKGKRYQQLMEGVLPSRRQRHRGRFEESKDADDVASVTSVDSCEASEDEEFGGAARRRPNDLNAKCSFQGEEPRRSTSPCELDTSTEEEALLPHGNFDLESKINALPPLDIEAFSQRKNQNNRRNRGAPQQAASANRHKDASSSSSSNSSSHGHPREPLSSSAVRNSNQALTAQIVSRDSAAQARDSSHSHHSRMESSHLRESVPVNGVGVSQSHPSGKAGSNSSSWMPHSAKYNGDGYLSSLDSSPAKTDLLLASGVVCHTAASKNSSQPNWSSNTEPPNQSPSVSEQLNSSGEAMECESASGGEDGGRVSTSPVSTSSSSPLTGSRRRKARKQSITRHEPAGFKGGVYSAAAVPSPLDTLAEIAVQQKTQ